MTADPYPLFSVFSFLGFVVALIPFPWHLQAWNAGTCMYMLWTAFASLIQFVNSILWHGNADIKATVWCDIATKFIIGAGVGIPASSLCINRRLYKIATVQAVTISRRERQRAIFIDLAIAGGIPILVMALHYIVQGHRFNIIEDIGCNPAIFNTPPAYPLVFIWPVALGCVSFVYALLTLRAFWRRRIQFQQFVSASTSMTFNRYLRLMLLSCLEMGLTVPLSAYSIYSNTAGRNLDPWISWSNAHFNFSHIEQVPSLLWRMNGKAVIALEMGRWLYPCCAFLFFALFGFAEEARRNYRTAFWWIATRLGLKRSTKPTYIGSSLSSSIPPPRFHASESLPQYSPRRTTDSDIDLEKSACSEKTLFSPVSLPSKEDIFIPGTPDSPPVFGAPACHSINLVTPPSPTNSDASHIATYHAQ